MRASTNGEITAGTIPSRNGSSGSMPKRPNGSSLTRTILKTDNRSYAAYGQLIYSITDQLELTAGGRLTPSTTPPITPRSAGPAVRSRPWS